MQKEFLNVKSVGILQFTEQIGDIEVYTKINSANDLSIVFVQNNKIIKSDVVFTNNVNDAIEKLLMNLDIYTLKWIIYNLPNVKKISKNVYKAFENDLFYRIIDTKYFKHIIGDVKNE